MSRRLTVLRHGRDHWNVSGDETVTTVDRLRAELSGHAFRHLLGYGDARILTHRLETIGRPLKLGILLRALSRGGCRVEDEQGRHRPLSASLLARWTWQALREPFQKPALLRSIAEEVRAIEDASRGGRPVRFDRTAPAAYLRTDLSFGLKAGGSVGHIAGVINHLHEFVGRPIFLTTDLIPTVDPGIETHAVAPSESFWEYPELPTFVMNGEFRRTAARVLAARSLSLVYQRYSLNNFAGAQIALARRVPFVLEYNGSEVWMSRHWGSPLEYEALSERIELAVLAAADEVVVVSQAMADELAARGVPSRKILVNPNGVEPERYSPAVDGSVVRRRYGLEGRTVLGFIGTFGPWHGAEVLARAFGRMLAARPDYRSHVRLLMIDDGVKMPEVIRALDESGARDLSILAGIVPQEAGPAYLAACDVLVSPHVPNADGTPFFGSPTKLFEYMAMGKGIVASDLDQIGEILEHGRAARMVKPGDVEDLVSGMEALIDDGRLRERLGAEARRLVVERHTWHAHVRRIITRLQELVPAA